MITKVILPKSGMGIEEGTLARWHKAVGDQVKKGELLADIETAKATQELEAPASGRLVKILLAEGESVAVNAEIAEIEDDV
jgi:pyruvate/2-oxoglutarate dehydrogenase complex dihydrolipoamide acyltransferase (E2) component